ncbi:ABC transporter substrate-binding protein [Streptomyces indicus]|uniref:ABC-type branched-chain amino acid transport system, substrate-binding protein n=1 Tax=Streptomyces indicus TaxID=417292 RepID=A0A1G8Z7K9_9ACTN|nr:ABC transporter substrate-binding protein [Streptomyces indicus]SDK10624.1 ABC-type branched-chain amino acid transport system, substrate-binding protein [Streptomyces indicus]
MVTQVPPTRREETPVRIGALAPLSAPGWAEAGQHLIAGLELAVDEVNADGGIAGRPLELLIRDTGADPQRAAEAVAELAGLGVAALVGEYHSVVARAAAARAEALGLPFLCSSAVIDTLTDEPAHRVARIAPAQSHGWRLYADFLLKAGHRRIAVAAQPSVYWAAGTGILREHLAPLGGTVVELGLPEHEDPRALCGGLAAHEATALLLLVGHPEPAVPLVRAVRADPRLGGVLIGAPAGQPEFASWAEQLGADGAGVPFLRYLPERFGPLGTRVGQDLRERLGAAPSFVGFEGYDTVAVLAEVLRTQGVAPEETAAAWERTAAAWSEVAVDGTRGLIRFSRTSGTGIWQWAWPPVQIADRDPADPGSFRVLHSG